MLMDVNISFAYEVPDKFYIGTCWQK